jgi:hypothetical protein
MNRHAADDVPELPAAQSSALRLWRAGVTRCAAVGLGTGFAGFQVNGGMTWFIAIPVILAHGCFVFADPTACLPSQRRRRARARSTARA